MSDFKFINTMSTEHHNAVIANGLASGLMDHANRQHHLAVHKATARIETRAANRYTRSIRRAQTLDTAVMAASVAGIAVATWFLTSIGAN